MALRPDARQVYTSLLNSCTELQHAHQGTESAVGLIANDLSQKGAQRQTCQVIKQSFGACGQQSFFLTTEHR